MTNLPPPESDRATPTTDLVRRAVLQLKAFGDLNRGQVRRVLPYWRHFVSLSAREMLAVVEAFPPGEDYAAVVPGRMIGSEQ
jgi:hypothetical protein